MQIGQSVWIDQLCYKIKNVGPDTRPDAITPAFSCNLVCKLPSQYIIYNDSITYQGNTLDLVS